MTQQGSNPNPMASEADRIEEDCLYSAKGHFESARIWGRMNLWLGIPAAALGAFAGITGFKDMPEVAGGLAVFAAAFTAVLPFLKPSERAAAHQRSGTLFNSLKNRVRHFREI